MRIAFGSDMKGELTEAIDRWLHSHGYEIVRFGMLASDDADAWPSIGRSVAECVVRGDAECGLLCCWTGTGVSIAANKVAGARAALSGDAATAAGARQWNDANVLCMSIRSTSAAVAEEILTAWFSSSPTTDPKYRAMIDEIKSL